jgi:hypothetical protein
MKPFLIGFSYIISSWERKAVAKPEASRITKKEVCGQSDRTIFFYLFTCVCEREVSSVVFCLCLDIGQ